MTSTHPGWISLSSLRPGARAVICDYTEQSDGRPLSGRMMEMGLTVGAEIEVAYEAPFGAAIAVRCRGALIALRLCDARLMQVNPI